MPYKPTFTEGLSIIGLVEFLMVASVFNFYFRDNLNKIAHIKIDTFFNSRLGFF